MLRISKLTDYAVFMLTCFVRASDGLLAARDLAELSRIPQPTVGKLLKVLCKANIVVSHRGARGGYSLARPPEGISLAEIIIAVDGPIELTDCSGAGIAASVCNMEGRCYARTNWRRINDAISKALDGISLAEMCIPGEVRGAPARALSVVGE